MSLERDFLKRFLTTYSIKTLLSFLSILRKKRRDFSLVVSDSSNARFALSISLFSYLYHRIKEKLAGLLPDNRYSSSARYFVAGNERFIAFSPTDRVTALP